MSRLRCKKRRTFYLVISCFIDSVNFVKCYKMFKIHSICLSSDSLARATVDRAIREWEMNTCLRFKRRSFEGDYVEFVMEPGWVKTRQWIHDMLLSTTLITFLTVVTVVTTVINVINIIISIIINKMPLQLLQSYGNFVTFVKIVTSVTVVTFITIITLFIIVIYHFPCSLYCPLSFLFPSDVTFEGPAVTV